jgi:hypothetical protein
MEVPDCMLTEESGIGPRRPRHTSYAHLREAARWILLDHLNDPRYEVITEATLQHLDPAISLRCKHFVVAGENGGGQNQSDGDQREYTEFHGLAVVITRIGDKRNHMIASQ